MRVIVLNSNNIVPDGQNNKLIYTFPNSILFKNNSIAVSSISMYYSWFNIADYYQNNIFTYQWLVGTSLQTFTITIPNGLYEIADLNTLLQYNFINNGTYLIGPNNQNAYYAQFILNPVLYSVQINTFNFPTTLPTNYTTPSNFVGFPTTSFNPIINIPPQFNIILGFSPNYATPLNANNAYVPPTNQTLITKNGAGTISSLSTQAPDVQPNSSIFVSLTNINNPYASPSSIIYSVVPSGNVGTLILDRPPQFMWNKMIDGTYDRLQLTFLGNNLQPIKINDPSITIMLTIKDADEIGIK